MPASAGFWCSETPREGTGASACDDDVECGLWPSSGSGVVAGEESAAATTGATGAEGTKKPPSFGRGTGGVMLPAAAAEPHGIVGAVVGLKVSTYRDLTPALALDPTATAAAVGPPIGGGAVEEEEGRARAAVVNVGGGGGGASSTLSSSPLVTHLPRSCRQEGGGIVL